jgi:DNA-binding XRE family transcriptional regulator
MDLVDLSVTQEIAEDVKTRVLIADRLTWLRVEIFQMTQEQLAQEFGWKHYQTISKYEIGALKPSIKRCGIYIHLASQFGHDIKYEWLRPDLYVKPATLTT